MEDLNKKLDEVEKELRDETVTKEKVEELENKVAEIEEEKKSLEKKAEERAANLDKAIAAKSIKESFKEEREEKNMEKEYRNAYFKKLMGKELTAEEERALTTTTTATIPTETSDKIFEKMVQLAPLLGEIELLHVKGNVKFAVETTRAAAGYHAENSTGISVDSTAVLTEIKLGSYEFTKLIQVSSNMLEMSIDAFENWLVDMLSSSIATKIEYEIINGSGESAVKGINALTFVDGTNGVQFNGSTGVTANEVRELIGYLPAGYDKGAKFLMNKKTLFNQIMGLQDNSKHDLVRVEGNNYFVYGYPVILSDEVSVNVLFLGNFKKYVGNLSSDIEVKKDFDIDTNSYKYLGVANFDGKPACADAFVKMAASL